MQFLQERSMPNVETEECVMLSCEWQNYKWVFWMKNMIQMYSYIDMTRKGFRSAQHEIHKFANDGL